VGLDADERYDIFSTVGVRMLPRLITTGSFTQQEAVPRVSPFVQNLPQRDGAVGSADGLVFAIGA
jgi:hypothetical protein